MTKQEEFKHYYPLMKRQLMLQGMAKKTVLPLPLPAGAGSRAVAGVLVAADAGDSEGIFCRPAGRGIFLEHDQGRPQFTAFFHKLRSRAGVGLGEDCQTSETAHGPGHPQPGRGAGADKSG